MTIQWRMSHGLCSNDNEEPARGEKSDGLDKSSSKFLQRFSKSEGCCIKLVARNHFVEFNVGNSR